MAWKASAATALVSIPSRDFMILELIFYAATRQQAPFQSLVGIS